MKRKEIRKKIEEINVSIEIFKSQKEKLENQKIELIKQDNLLSDEEQWYSEEIVKVGRG